MNIPSAHPAELSADFACWFCGTSAGRITIIPPGTLLPDEMLMALTPSVQIERVYVHGPVCAMGGEIE